MTHTLFVPVVFCVFILIAYQFSIWSGIVPASNGINQRQGNVIKAQRYLYDRHSHLNMLLVGSSMTAGLKSKYFGSHVTNIAMLGSNSQTGLELVKINHDFPSLLLVEINETIAQKVDKEFIESVSHPFLYFIRLYLPMFREEYKPISVFVHSLKSISTDNQPTLKTNQAETEEIKNPLFREKFINKMAATQQNKLSANAVKNLREQAQYIKKQIAKLQKKEVRVVLFNLPTESRLANTPRREQIRSLMRDFFPPEQFEWLPEPPSQEWTTSDGIHLVPSHAKAYAEFIKAQLMSPAFSGQN